MTATRVPVQLLLGLLCCLLVPLAAADDLSGQDYLDRMSKAFRELDYQGVFTYEYGAEMEPLRIIHVVRDGVEHERLIYLNGRPREIVRNGQDVSCIHSGGRILRLGHAIATGPFARTFLATNGKLSTYYDLSVGHHVRIADRPAVEIFARPRDRYRNGLRLYLDQATSLLLKSVVLSPGGNILERFQFVRISVGKVNDDALEAAGQKVGDDHPEHVLQQTGKPGLLAQIGSEVFSVGWMPPGFELVARTTGETTAHPSELTMYTDGLATISVAVEPFKPSRQGAPLEGRAQKGATVAFTREIGGGKGSYLVTVVGEVPLRTAVEVARHIKVAEEKP